MFGFSSKDQTGKSNSLVQIPNSISGNQSQVIGNNNQRKDLHSIKEQKS